MAVPGHADRKNVCIDQDEKLPIGIPVFCHFSCSLPPLFLQYFKLLFLPLLVERTTKMSPSLLLCHLLNITITIKIIIIYGVSRVLGLLQTFCEYLLGNFTVTV